MKNRYLAAALNILPGAGYLYAGVRTPFAVLLLLIIPAAFVAGIADPAMSSSPDTGMSWGILLVLGVPILAFVVDAFNEATRVNQANKPASRITKEPIIAADLGVSKQDGRNPATGLWDGFMALKPNLKPVAIMVAIGTVVSAVPPISRQLSGLPATTTYSGIWLYVFLAGLALISAIDTILLVIAVASARGNKLTLSAAVRKGLRRLPALIGLGLLETVFIGVGLILFIVPGIILMLRFSLARYILIDRNVGPMESLRQSSRLMKKNSLQVIGVGGLVAVISLITVVLQLVVPVIGPIVGALLIYIVSAAMHVFLTRLYRDLEGIKKAGYSRLKAHWINIVFVIPMIIVAAVAAAAISFALFAVVFKGAIIDGPGYTTTSNITVLNDTKEEVTASRCGSDPLSIKPGQSNAYDAPQRDAKVACIIYDHTGYIGCLSTPTTDTNKAFKISMMSKKIDEKSCGD